MTSAQQQAAAKSFAAYWKDKGYEKGESQKFWLSLLRDVFGVAEPEKLITFEDQVKLDSSTGFIDGYIAETKVMIEQKGSGKDLNKPIRQSDGSMLNPFQQAKKYITELPLPIWKRNTTACPSWWTREMCICSGKWRSPSKPARSSVCCMTGC